MWSFVGFLTAILLALLGPFSIDLILLTLCACTPAIWLRRNTEILQDFMTYLESEEDNQDEGQPGEIESDFGGIWAGN